MPKVEDLTPLEQNRLLHGHEVWDGQFVTIAFKLMTSPQVEKQKDDIFEWLENNTTGKYKVVTNIGHKLVAKIEKEQDVIMFKLTFQI